MANQYFLARIAGHDPNLRAGDADRERTADRLRKAHAEGRLDLAEFQERLEHCYAAKTIGELSAVVRDLPREDPPAERSAAGWLRPWRLAPLLIAIVVLAAASAGHHHDGFWLWIPVLFLIWRLSSWRRRRWTAGPRRGPGDWI